MIRMAVVLAAFFFVMCRHGYATPLFDDETMLLKPSAALTEQNRPACVHATFALSCPHRPFTATINFRARNFFGRRRDFEELQLESEAGQRTATRRVLLCKSSVSTSNNTILKLLWSKFRKVKFFFELRKQSCVDPPTVFANKKHYFKNLKLVDGNEAQSMHSYMVQWNLTGRDASPSVETKRERIYYNYKLEPVLFWSDEEI